MSGAGRGQYSVGAGETFTSIQAAVDALVTDQGAVDFEAEQVITVLDSGVYEPFRIPADSLRPTSEFRLKIRAAPGARPVVSGRKNSAKSQVGCLVGNAIPYVTIQGLAFRDLIKGIVFGVNAHRGIVNGCVLTDCGNVAVWFYQADECILANSILINADHLLVAQKVKSVSVLHNTFFNDSNASRDGNKTYCLFVDLQDNRGQDEEDTGRATIFNNIVYSRSDFGLLIYEKDVTLIDADYNDWFCPNENDGGLAEIREPVLDEVNREFVRKLHTDDLNQSDVSWRLRSGQDFHSISDDPGFIKPAGDTESASIDLSLFAWSPVLGKGNLTYELPAYIEDETIRAFDKDGKPRQADCAIGAIETSISQTYFSGLAFGSTNNPSDLEDGESDASLESEGCQSDFTAVDKAVALYAHAVPLWTPKVHKGHFFVRDAEYHLFAKKRGLYIRDIQRTAFPTSCRLIEDGATVYVAGVDVTATATWEIDGYVFLVAHSGVEFEEDSEVELHAFHRYWDEAMDAFAQRIVVHRWRVNEGKHSYVLPSNPAPGSPIVITDDLIRPWNQTGLYQEFRQVYDPERDETRIELSTPRNLWINSDFSYVDETGVHVPEVLDTEFTGSLPLSYEIDGELITTMPRGRTDEGVEVDSLRGELSLLLGTGDQAFIGQRHRIDPLKPYVFTAHASSLTTGEQATIGLSLEFIDRDGNSLETIGPLEVDLPACEAPDLAWVRFGLGFYGSADLTLNRTAFSEFAVPAHTGVQIPDEADVVVIKLHPGEANVVVDALQLEEGYRPGIYTRIPVGDDLTVEYDEEDRLFYEVVDLSLQPVRNAQGHGFLSIFPVQARQWDPDAPGESTTLSDYLWPWGRVNLLPWARLDGISKYQQRSTFSTLERAELDEPVSLAPPSAFPRTIRTEPTLLVARQGSEGEIFSIEVTDQFDNPYAFENIRATVIDPTGEFAGYLAKQEWGQFTELAQQISTRLNEAGAAPLRWIPPEPEHVEFRGEIPEVQTIDVAGEEREVGYVDTYYRVWNVNHGTPTLRDYFGNLIGLEGSRVTGEFLGVQSEGATVLTLPRFPTPASVELYVSETGESPTTRLLESFTSPTPNRHYQVDYEQGIVSLAGDWRYPILIGYTPRLAWRDPAYPRRVYIDGEVLTALTGDMMSLQYDAEIDLIVEALVPTGMPETQTTFLRLPIVAQHNDREVL